MGMVCMNLRFPTLLKKNDAKRQIIPNASKKRFQYGEHLTYEPLASKMSHFEPLLSHF